MGLTRCYKMEVFFTFITIITRCGHSVFGLFVLDNIPVLKVCWPELNCTIHLYYY